VALDGRNDEIWFTLPFVARPVRGSGSRRWALFTLNRKGITFDSGIATTRAIPATAIYQLWLLCACCKGVLNARSFANVFDMRL
jgi:hypothetical protein